MTYHPHYGKTVAERYRLIRRDDPYRPATVALGHARADLDAERAGIGPWPDGMAADPVTVAGETYYVTVDYDIDTRAADFDCYGSIGPSDPYAVERAGYNGPPVDWPEVREGGQTWTYHPGAYYDPDSAARWAWRQGMPRGAVREHLRGEAVAGGVATPQAPSARDHVPSRDRREGRALPRVRRRRRPGMVERLAPYSELRDVRRCPRRRGVIPLGMRRPRRRRVVPARDLVVVRGRSGRGRRRRGGREGRQAPNGAIRDHGARLGRSRPSGRGACDSIVLLLDSVPTTRERAKQWK